MGTSEVVVVGVDETEGSTATVRLCADDRAGHSLEHVASNERADAIVIGASRRRAVVARLLGTVVDELAHHPSIPLVVVPASYGDAPGVPDEPGRGS